jgi:phosphatidylinositol alpha 1,6-mannosyltransferase
MLAGPGAGRVPRPATAAGLRLALCTDTYAPQINGVARTLERLVQAVEARGGAVQVITVDDPESQVDPRVERLAAIPFWAYPQLRVAAPALRAARRALEAFRPTLVHAATPFGVGLGARQAARQLGLPLVTSYHTHFTAYLRHYKLEALDGISWPFLRWFHNSGLRTYAPTETVRRELAAQGFERTAVWGRGVDPQRFNPSQRSAAWRAQQGIGRDELVALYVGRIAPEKGIGVLLDAMARVQAAWPGRVRFVLTGDGPAEEKARALAPAGTVFTGRLTGEALGRAYASADLFVFPSETETFGNVVLEAMASGLAVVAPDAGPTLEFAHAGTAALYRAGDAAALAAQVLALAGDDTARARLGHSARAEALRHDWDAIFDALVADYQDASRGAAAGPLAGTQTVPAIGAP